MPGPTRVAMSFAINSLSASLRKLNSISISTVVSIGVPFCVPAWKRHCRKATSAFWSSPKPSSRTIRRTWTPPRASIVA